MELQPFLFLIFMTTIAMKSLYCKSRRDYVCKFSAVIYFCIYTNGFSVEVPIAKLAPSMDKMRIGLISDIHLGPTVGYTQLKRVVDMTNALNPGTSFHVVFVVRQLSD